MTNKYPVSEQIERGAPFFNSILVETSVGVPLTERETQALPLADAWGPYTHVNLRATLHGSLCPSDTARPTLLRPTVQLALRIDPELDFGLVTQLRYEPILIDDADVNNDNKQTRIRIFAPTYCNLSTRRYWRDGGNSGQVAVGFGSLRKSWEGTLEGIKTAEALSRGLGVLEGLGSTGIQGVLLAEGTVYATPAEMHAAHIRLWNKIDGSF